MKWIRFQPPGPGRRAVGHRPTGRALRSGEQQPEVAALDVGERRRGVRQDLEAEELGVEGDRRLDVVDHVADVDGLIVGHVRISLLLACRCEEREQEADAGLELGGGALERRVGGAVGRTLERRVGDAPVDELGSRRELRADLANAVAQRDHRVEPLGAELVEVLGAVGADVDARTCAGRGRRWDAAASGGCRRWRRRSCRPTCCSSSASAIWDRALFPVHRNKHPPSADASPELVDVRRGAGTRRNAGMQRAAGVLQCVAAGRRGRWRSSCRGRRPSCAAR